MKEIKCQKPSCKNVFIPSCSRQVYCCYTCSNRDNQRRNRLKTRKNCPKCDKIIMGKSNFCKKCFKSKQLKDYTKIQDMTLEHYQNMDSVKNKHPSWRNSHIRSFARSWSKKDNPCCCEKCGYKLHVEVCHIKAIKDFDIKATLGEINSINNLLFLCRNCHWEFDHNLFSIEDIKHPRLDSNQQPRI